MSNYEYSSYSSSSTTGGVPGGHDPSRTVFNQVDTNRDGGIDRGEFNQWLGAVSGGAGQIDGGNVAVAGGTVSTDAEFIGATGGSSFEQSSYTPGVVVDAGIASGSSFPSSSSFETVTTGANYDAAAVNQAASYTAETNAAWSRYGAEVRGAGLYFDANPQIIRRPAAGGVHTYTQNIKVRFLQPPPVPPPGPLIIKEVRPPQPPPPPPLRIRQRAPPLPKPPPLVLRERPPLPPRSVAAQTVIRRLAALPVPPRSVIIERIPAAPAPPRDIIIERWIPYGALAKRKTIVQRAERVKEYPRPRNIIIQYEPIQVRVVRQFQRLGITQENPQAYYQRYGAQLLDSQTLVQQARAAGIIEDISPPISSATASYTSSSVSTGGVGEAELVGATAGEYEVTSSFSPNSFETSEIAGAGFAGAGFESSLVEGAGGYGVDAGFDYASSSYDASGFSAGDVTGSAGFDVAGATFNSADKNKDGTIDPNEFKEFYQGGL